MSNDPISVTLEPREVTGKAVKHLRKEGKIPAVIHDHGIHADQRVTADRAAVEHSPVADMAILPDHRVGTGEPMHDTGILQVGPGFQDQAAEIAAQAGIRPDIGTGTDNDVANQYRGGMHIGRGVDDGNYPVDGIDFHWFGLRWIRLK